MKILYKEEQKFNRRLTLAFLGPITILTAIALYSQYLHTPHEMGIKFYLTLSLLVIQTITIIIVCTAKLQTVITETEIILDFYPILFTPKKITWNEVESFKIRKYNPITEYGGWGAPLIKLPSPRGFNRNRALNTQGDIGLQLHLKDGNKLLVGTQKPNELEMALLTLNN
jgi:hypothetical protein